MTKELKDGISALHFKSRKAWRTWLEKHHKKGHPVWLILHRKGVDVSCVLYVEAVDEALCIGWIDSKTVRRDEE